MGNILEKIWEIYEKRFRKNLEKILGKFFGLNFEKRIFGKKLGNDLEKIFGKIFRRTLKKQCLKCLCNFF